MGKLLANGITPSEDGMTIFKNKGKNWEWTLLVDTCNNEILAHQVTLVSGSSKP